MTGLAKEVLRKWEVRYGFPVPERNAIGHRKFTQGQVSRLQMIKTLLDGGLSARHVVPLASEDLEAACVAIASTPQARLSETETHDVLSVLLSHEPLAILSFLNTRLADLGLRDFVTHFLPSINTLVGNAWVDGRISIRNEHLYTESIKSILSREIAALTKPKAAPRVLLATATGEAHTVGLLMVGAILALEGVECVSLGAQLDTTEIAAAAMQYQVNVVALSFSENFPLKKASDFLKQLRRGLPGAIEIWGGGAGVMRLPTKLRGIQLITDINRVADAVNDVRAALTPAIGQ